MVRSSIVLVIGKNRSVNLKEILWVNLPVEGDLVENDVFKIVEVKMRVRVFIGFYKK